VTDALTPPSDDEAALVHLDVGCAGCGYGLIGESYAGACPRCDVPVRRTVLPTDLILADARHLRRLRRGLTLVLAGILGQIVVGVGLVVSQAILSGVVPGLTPPMWEAIHAVGGVVVALVVAQGWWLFTEQDAERRYMVAGRTSAGMVRRAVFAHTVFVAIVLLGQWLAVLPALHQWHAGLVLTVRASGVGALVTLVVQFFGVMAYLGHAARGLRDARLTRLVRTRTWSCALWSTVGILLVGLGPLVALILYYNTIAAVRLRLGVVIRSHERGHERADDDVPDGTAPPYVT
jgi:hypothetical protein